MKNLMVFMVAVLCLAVLPSKAYAYLDPGTTGAILQGILAGLAAIVVALKLYWHRVLRFFGLRQSVDKKTLAEKD